jgi:hypothetical protein
MTVKNVHVERFCHPWWTGESVVVAEVREILTIMMGVLSVELTSVSLGA